MPELSAPALEFFSRAEELYDQGELDAAITCYRRGLEKAPGNIVAINNLSMVFIEKERYQDARSELERAIAAGAEDAELLSNLGYALRKLGNDPEAASVYERYLELSPNAEDAEPIRNWIARVHAAPAEAPAPAPVAPEPAPAPEAPAAPPPPPPPPPPAPPTPDAEPVTAPSGEELALIEKADEAYEDGRFDEAVQLYDKALAINVDSLPALSGRGRSQAKAGLMEEGLATLREAVQINPDDADNWYVIGFILRSLERDAEAAEAYERFLALAPEAGNAGKIRGWINEVNARQEVAPEPTPEAQPPAPAAVEVEAEEPAWASQLAEEPAPAVPDESAPEAPSVPEEPVQNAASPDPMPAPPPAAPEAKEAGGIGIAAPAPTGQPDTDEQKLDRIRMLLREGDAGAALSMAQEMVGQNPDMTEAKILIARCFGQQGEFKKALAILKNVVASDETDEALFFLGRCYQELGENKEARKTFERCREITEDPELTKRLDDLIGSVRGGGKGICACGKTVPVQELEDVDGQPLCAECRDNMAKAMGGEMPGAASAAEAKPARKKRAPAKRRYRKKGLLAPILLIVLFSPAAMLAGAAGGFYFALSDFVAEVERLNDLYSGQTPPSVGGGAGPVAHVPRPRPGDGGGETGDPGGGGDPATGGGGTDETPTLQQFVIDSPPISEYMVGAEYTHRLHASGAPGAQPVVFGVKFSREPAQPYRFDEKSGVLTWMPAPADLQGGPITITFTAMCGESAALEQSNEVTFRPAPRMRPLGLVAPVMPGEGVVVAAGDVGGDERTDLVLAHGDYDTGELILYLQSDQGLTEAARLALPGRPVAVGIGDFGTGEKHILVVDYWNAEAYLVRYDDELRRTDFVLELPGRPALAAIGNPDGEGPLGLAVLCPEVRAVMVYDAIAGTRLGLFKRLDLPLDGPWRALHMANLYEETPGGIYEEIALVRLGTRQPNLFVAGVEENSVWTRLSVGSGVVQNSCVGDVVGAPRPPLKDIALVSGSRDSVLHAFPGQAKGETSLSRRLPLPSSGQVFALQAADLEGNGTEDLVFCFLGKVYYRLRSLQGEGMRLSEVPSGEGAYPPLGPSVAGEFTGDNGVDVIYVSRAGELILVTTPAKETP